MPHDKHGDRFSKSRLSGFQLRKDGDVCPHLVFSQIISSFQFLFQVSDVQMDSRLSKRSFSTVINLATGAPSTAADHVCWQGWNLFLLANLRDSQISTSLIHLKPERPGVVRDATLMRFHTQTLRQRQEEGSQPRSLLYHFLLLEESVHSRVNSKVPQRQPQCLEGLRWRRLRCGSNQVKLDESARPPANFPVRSCVRSESRTASEVWEPEGSSCWPCAHRVYSALHR